MDTLSLAEAIYYDPEYSGNPDDMTNIRAIQAAIDARIGDARVAGYAEAIEKAAKVAAQPTGKWETCDAVAVIVERIRALAPADDKKDSQEKP